MSLSSQQYLPFTIHHSGISVTHLYSTLSKIHVVPTLLRTVDGSRICFLVFQLPQGFYPFSPFISCEHNCYTPSANSFFYAFKRDLTPKSNPPEKQQVLVSNPKAKHYIYIYIYKKLSGFQIFPFQMIEMLDVRVDIISDSIREQPFNCWCSF